MSPRTRKADASRSSTTSTASASDTALVLDAVRGIVQALRLASRQSEKRSGISAAQMFVLQRLGEHPSSSLGDLAERTFTHQSSVSVVVKRLVEDGLVARTRASDDARRIELELTAAGRAVLRRAPQAVQYRMIAALERLPAAERRQLARSLQHLVRAIGATAEAPAMFFEEKARR